MKKYLALLLCLLPLLTRAQTSTGRINASGQSTFDSIANTQALTISGITPSVAVGNVFKTANGGATNVTNFLGGHDAQVINIICRDVNTTFVNGATLITSAGSNLTCTLNAIYTFVFDSAQGAWIQTKSTGAGGGASTGNQFKVQTSNGGGGFSAGGASDDGTTFTVQEDMTNAGPNPYFNILNYGAFSSSNTATCSITAASTTLSCGTNPDFANGHGVVVPKAGAATILATPPQATVTPTNIINGATTYNYQLVAEDRTGGLTAAGTIGATTVGATTLGLNTLTLTSCVMTDGTTGVIGGSIATYTSSGNHNLQVGAQVDIEGFTGGVSDACNGTVTVVTTPTLTTFTVYKGQVGAETNTTGAPTAQVYACNELTFAASSVTLSTQMRYWVYRNTALVGVQPGLDPHYIDCGLTVTGAPAYIPSTPPGSSQVGYLVTTIVSGGGTTSLVLANAATTTATSQVVLHDNVPALRAAIQAAYTSGGGTVYIPSGGGFVFNSIFDATTGFSNVFTRSTRIQWNNTFSSINQPWILRASMSIEGDPHESGSFQYIQGPRISGTAHPMLYVVANQSGSGIYLKRLQLSPSGVMQTGFMSDEDSSGGGVTGIVFDDVTIGGNNGNSKPVIIRGGFDFFWTRGVCDVGAPGLRPNYCVTFSRASTALTGPSSLNAGQIVGRVKFEKVFVASSGIELDCRGSSTGSFANDYIFNNSLFEGMSMPYLKTTGCPNSQFSNIQINNLTVSDNSTGCSTPIVDSALGGVSYLSFAGGNPSCGTPAAFITVAGSNTFQAGGYQAGGYSRNPGNVDRISHLAGSQTNTRAFYPLTALAAPAVAVSAGGAVPIGTNPYQQVAVDIDFNETLISQSTNCVTTGGNQTCTITAPTLPAGAIGWVPYRNGAKANIPFCNILLPGVNYVDVFNFTCGQTAQSNALGFSLAGQSVLGPNGLSTYSFRLMNNGFSIATNFPKPLSASRTLYVPDITGMNVVSGNPNSAYDTFNRANGAVGSNWTTTVGTVNVASNVAQGTSAGTNLTQWSATTFSATQFAQATITALNGTTDFPGVAVLIQPSGDSMYNCMETTTTVFLQKRSAGTGTTLTSVANAGVAGDILRLEVTSTGALTCYKNGAVLLTTTDTTWTSGQPGLFLLGNVASEDNWSGGNLSPLAHLDIEQDFMRVQHLTQGATFGVSSNPALARYGRYTATLTPALVAANTCAAQTFTVTGALAADILIGVNKPTEQAGLSVTPGHVTGANSATLNFCNNTVAGITPTAAEVYNFVVVQ